MRSILPLLFVSLFAVGCRHEAQVKFRHTDEEVIATSSPDHKKRRTRAVPHFADWCAVDMLEGDSLRRVAVAHELRNRLAPIKSGLDLLRLEGGETICRLPDFAFPFRGAHSGRFSTRRAVISALGEAERFVIARNCEIARWRDYAGGATLALCRSRRCPSADLTRRLEAATHEPRVPGQPDRHFR